MVVPHQRAVDGVYYSDRILYFLQVQGIVYVLIYKMGWDVLPWVYPWTGLNESIVFRQVALVYKHHRYCTSII